MTINVKEELNKLKKTKGFKEWQEKNKEDYLVSVFFMSDKPKELQFDFYNKEKDLITSFSLNEKNIEKIEGSEILKSNEKVLNKLNLDKLISFEEVVGTARKLQREKYKADIPYKTIVALQNLDNFGNVWNITFITHNFKVLNIKIDSSDGKILEHKLQDVFSFRSK